MVEPTDSLPPPRGLQRAMPLHLEHLAKRSDFALGAGQRGRVSSLTPVIVSIAMVMVGCLFTLAALSKASAQPVLAGALLLVAAVHWLVGLVLKGRLKSVSFDGQRYRVKGLLLTDEFTLSDVCLVVEADGGPWKAIRIHFNRPTRFGYDIKFVPAGFRGGGIARLR